MGMLLYPKSTAAAYNVYPFSTGGSTARTPLATPLAFLQLNRRSENSTAKGKLCLLPTPVFLIGPAVMTDHGETIL